MKASSGTTAIATTTTSATDVIPAASTSCARHARIVSAVAGFFSLDGGTTWDRIPARDTYVMTRGGGTDTVLGFATGATGDLIRLMELGVASLDQVLLRTIDVAGSAVILLNGAQIVLIGVSKADLTAANFAFD